jgi:DNA-directed RNA polymerase subunit L
MNPKISDLEETSGYLTFYIENIDNCLINSLRRVILSDIPLLVFRSFPENENKIYIEKNTSRHNNEILKQRLGCIPIHIDDIDFPYEDYQIEIDKINDSDQIIYLTTEDIKIFNKKTTNYLSPNSVKKIFPPNSITNDYIIIARLRPALSENLEGEQIKLIADLSKSTAKNDGMYNVASTCSFGATIDPIKADEAWNEKKKTIKKENLEFEKKNWEKLEKKRYTKPNSFNFILESIGIYDNMNLMKIACDVLIKKLELFSDNLDDEKKIIIKNNNETTVKNEFIIYLLNEDYTIGNIIIYYLYQKYYLGDKSISFCGFRKEHPHIEKGEMRISFSDSTDVSTLVLKLKEASTNCIDVYKMIKKNFNNDIEN